MISLREQNRLRLIDEAIDDYNNGTLTYSQLCIVLDDINDVKTPTSREKSKNFSSTKIGIVSFIISFLVSRIIFK